ncbi:Poly(A)-specific ribonuclease PARN [Nymphon striatum]|nr:Poly(A)-specific ribonuclease PARN [Nymphon striatum]
MRMRIDILVDFKEKLPIILSSISESEVLSYDGEFTGLSYGEGIHAYDTPEERYLKLKEIYFTCNFTLWLLGVTMKMLHRGASNFMLIQFGLCTFHYDSTQDKYTHRAFNFYLFPRPFKRGAPDSRFMCQCDPKLSGLVLHEKEHLTELIETVLDVTKFFEPKYATDEEGEESLSSSQSNSEDDEKASRIGEQSWCDLSDSISYLTPADKEKLRTEIVQKHESYKQRQSLDNSSNDTSQIPIPPEYEDFINGICTKIDLLLESSEESSVELPPANRFLRKLIYQTGKKPKYNGKIHIETKSADKDGRISTLAVTKVSNSDELKDLKDAKLKEELDELEDAIGFSKIIDCISKSGKLLVGHNMLLDILLSINQFRCPLPETYEDFKALAQCIFPRILDTKLMASLNPFKDYVMGTALDNLQKQLNTAPFSQPTIVESSEDFDGYDTNNLRLHEAGYDAFITGVCFITMCKYLGSLQRPSLDTVNPNSPLLEPYINKLFLLRVQDIPYMNLGGAEVKVNRDHVFHLTFPNEWKISDLFQLFTSYGQIHIAWIDDVSAFVALRNNLDNSSNVIKTLGQSNVYKILTYKEYVSIKKENKNHEITLKSVPVSDVALSSVRRKRKNAIENTLKRNIDPIPEEDESEEQPVEKKKRNEDDKKAETVRKEGLSNKKNSNSKTNKKKFNEVASPSNSIKLFQEIENWDD